MAGVLERIHRANRPAFHSLTPKQARIAYLMGAEILDLPRAPLPRIENLQLPGAEGPLAARLYAPRPLPRMTTTSPIESQSWIYSLTLRPFPPGVRRYVPTLAPA